MSPETVSVSKLMNPIVGTDARFKPVLIRD